jgi:hypothetical protein
MVSLIEFILGSISLTPVIIHAWDAISPYLPQEIIKIVPIIKLYLFSFTGLVIFGIYILFVFWRINLEKTFIKLDYRFQRNPNLLNISSTNLEDVQGEPTYIFINARINSRICRLVLSILRCKPLLIFKSPRGVTIGIERQYSDVNIVDNDKPHFLILASDFEGTRRIELSISKDELASYITGAQISMRVCIGPNIWLLRKPLQYINGTLWENKIDIV